MDQKQTGRVNVKRQFSWESFAVPFNIYIDNEKASELKHGQSLSFDLEYGEHTIYFNLQGKMQSKYKSIKKTFVLSPDKPTVNVKCRIWGYGLLFTSLFITENHIIVNID